MNSIEILYQIYRARYSLTRVQEALDKGFKLAVIGPEEQQNAISGWLGELREGASTASLIRMSMPLSEEDIEKFRDCEAVVVHMGKELPEGDFLREQARLIPLRLRALWLVETTSVNKLESLESDGATPRLYRLDPIDPGPIFIRHLLRFFPGIAINVARDYSKVRYVYSRALTRRAASRASVLAAASTIPAPPIPALKIVWGFFATTGETMAITASQLRLCLLVAALHGRPVDFFDRVGELWPIIGSAFGWRTLARELIGLVPVAGWAFKTSLAYSGTWLVGEGSRLYYEHGQPTEGEKLRELKRLSRIAAMEAIKEAVLDDADEPPDPPQADSVESGSILELPRTESELAKLGDQATDSGVVQAPESSLEAGENPASQEDGAQKDSDSASVRDQAGDNSESGPEVADKLKAVTDSGQAPEGLDSEKSPDQAKTDSEPAKPSGQVKKGSGSAKASRPAKDSENPPAADLANEDSGHTETASSEQAKDSEA